MDTTKAQQIANDKLKEFKLDDWTFEFDNSKRRLGCCHQDRKMITLSLTITKLNEETRVLNTLLHEIAHAIVGVKEGHGRVWRRKALEIGCDAVRAVKAEEIITAPSRYIYECPKCKIQIKRHKLTKTMKHACKECCYTYNRGKYSNDYVFVRVK